MLQRLSKNTCNLREKYPQFFKNILPINIAIGTKFNTIYSQQWLLGLFANDTSAFNSLITKRKQDTESSLSGADNVT